MKTEEWLRKLIEVINDFEPVAPSHPVNPTEKGKSMQRLQWVVSHHDTFGQKPPKFYDREKCQLVEGKPTAKHMFNNRVDAETVRNKLGEQLHGGLLKIELAD